MEIIGSMWVVFFALAAAVLLMLLVYMLDSRSRAERQGSGWKEELQPTASVIDESVRRYKDHHRAYYFGQVHWSCASRKFQFRISLDKEGRKFRIRVGFPVSIPYKMSQANKPSTWNKKTKGLLTEDQQVPALLQPLSYFDTVRVGEDYVSASKVTSELDPGEWKEGLSGLITFVRYLLETSSRAELKIQGEALCPYCREPVAGSIVSCRECNTAHHQECWEETGRCSVFGCRSKSELILTAKDAKNF
jgi:hypothetical protein